MSPNHERWYWNPEFIVHVQEFFGPNWEIPFRTITLLADSTVVLILATLIFWTRGRRYAYTALAATMLGALISTVIKFGTDVPRPEHIEMIAYETRIAPAFPSGHAMHGVAFWGTLAYLGLIRVPAAVAIAISVMLSRLFLGTHYPIDVIVGAMIGLFGVLIGHLVWTRILTRLTDQQIGSFIGVALLGSVVIIPVANEFPLGWEILGGLLGAGVGLLIESRLVNYQPASRDWNAALVRIAVGVAGVLVFGLITVLVRETGGGPLLRSLSTFPLGLWAMFIAPYILDRLGLNDKVTDAPSPVKYNPTLP